MTRETTIRNMTGNNSISHNEDREAVISLPVFVFLLMHLPPVEHEEIPLLLFSCLEHEAEIMNSLSSLDLGCKLCEFVLCTWYFDCADTFAV